MLCSSALASPEFEGRGGEELGHHLAHQLAQAYCHHSAIDRQSLCIVPGQQCWILYVDVLVRICCFYGTQHLNTRCFWKCNQDTNITITVVVLHGYYRYWSGVVVCWTYYPLQCVLLCTIHAFHDSLLLGKERKWRWRCLIILMTPPPLILAMPPSLLLSLR